MAHIPMFKVGGLVLKQMAKVKELSESAAVIRGADVLGEAVVLGVGVAVLVYEYRRGVVDKQRSDKKAAEERAHVERVRNRRLEELEDSIRQLRAEIAELKSRRPMEKSENG